MRSCAAARRETSRISGLEAGTRMEIDALSIDDDDGGDAPSISAATEAMRPTKVSSTEGPLLTK